MQVVVFQPLFLLLLSSYYHDSLFLKHYLSSRSYAVETVDARIIYLFLSNALTLIAFCCPIVHCCSTRDTWLLGHVPHDHVSRAHWPARVLCQVPRTRWWPGSRATSTRAPAAPSPSPPTAPPSAGTTPPHTTGSSSTAASGSKSPTMSVHKYFQLKSNR